MTGLFRTLLVVGLMLLVSCAADEGEIDAGVLNAELARTGYEAFSRGDIDGVVGLMDPAIVWHEAESLPYGGIYHGPDAVLENIFMAVGRDWEPYSAIPRKFIQAGDHVVVLGDYSGTHRETGRAFAAPFSHVWRFENGLLVEFWQFTDTALWLAALEDS